MRDAILLGLGRWMIPVPGMIWRRAVRAQAGKARESLSFMTPDHHRVRDFAVTELFGMATPLEPESIARSLRLPAGRVAELLEDLERHLTFLYRSRGPDVTWAYPVTVDPTVHRGKASTGEEAYSPWAIDAFAMPFVQGQLSHNPLTVCFETECAHCSRPLQLEIASDLSYRVAPEMAGALVFVPSVDFAKLRAKSILDDF